MSRNISYRDGYRYQLAETFSIVIKLLSHPSQWVDNPPVVGDLIIDTDYITLDEDGLLTIKKGYAWDGPSGPTFDTKNFMRGSLVHDVLYQLIREGHLSYIRLFADNLLRTLCREDGMSWIRAWWIYRALRLFGSTAADPASKKPILTAPREVIV